jgi:hypothetical protein
MKHEVIETRTAKIWVGVDGIMRVISLPNVDVDLADMKEINEHLVRLSGGKKIPVFDDIRGVKSITREARLFTSSAEAVQVSQAAALLIGSPVSSIIGNFFLGINKPPYPTRLFTSEEAAIKWLKGFTENQNNSK